jgi:hypothetical protein
MLKDGLQIKKILKKDLRQFRLIHQTLEPGHDIRIILLKENKRKK